MPSLVWERLPWRAYCLACLEQWDQALAVAKEAAEFVEQDPKASLQSPDSPLKILSIVLALARYQTDTTYENRKGAIETLQPQAVNLGEDADTTGAVYGQLAAPLGRASRARTTGRRASPRSGGASWRCAR